MSYKDLASSIMQFLTILTALRHLEATANMGAALYCLNRFEEAEQHWRRVIGFEPAYLDAAEHLVGLLYKERSEDAIGIISHIQLSLRRPPAGLADSQLAPGAHESENAMAGSRDHSFIRGYRLPAEENGRMLALVHAKGTMLYGLKKISLAAEAFEEAVLISTGHRLRDAVDLIQHIQLSLSSSHTVPLASTGLVRKSQPLLLAPDLARQTAQLAFGSKGNLPGLTHIKDSIHVRAAIQTTSNALLSLAKILQDALASGSSDVGLQRGPSGVGDILTLYYLSLSLQESPSTANNVGILLAGIQQPHDGTRRNISSGSCIGVQIPGIPPGSGLELALLYYNYGLKLDPKHVHLHTNLGSLLKDVGQLDLAIQMYERAVSCDGSFDIALTNLANAVKDKGRIKDAIKYYRRAIAANPNFAEAVCGLFTALNSICNWRGRGGSMMEDGKFDRWHVAEDGRLIDAKGEHQASGLTKAVVGIIHKQLIGSASWGRGILDAGLASRLMQYCKPLLVEPGFDFESKLNAWRGAPWEGSKVVRLLERVSRVAMRASYVDSYATKDAMATRTARIKPPVELSVPAAPTVLPFHTFTCPLSATHIRMISQRNALRISCSTLRAPWLPRALSKPPAPPSPHLNVGYVSSDFNNHPLAHL